MEFETIKSEIIYFIIILLTSGTVATFITSFYNKKMNYIDFVTKERLKWLSEFKSDCTELILLSNVVRMGDVESIEKTYLLKSKIYFKLNILEEIDFIIILQNFAGDIISSCKTEKIASTLEENRARFICECNILFKNEWELIKSEATMKKFKFSRREYRKNIDKIIQKKKLKIW